MLHNRNEAVGTNSRVYLYSESVLSSSPEFLNFEVLLDPLEEQLYLPTVLVEVGNLLSGQFHCISKEHELTALLLVIEPDKPQMLRIAFLAAINAQFYLRVSEDSLGQFAPPSDTFVLQIRLSRLVLAFARLLLVTCFPKPR